MDLDKRLLIVCGPTATGKTRLALGLARKFNGEIVSCDSRQVYRFMDVVIGKDIPKNFIYRFSDFDYPPLRIGYYSCRNQSIIDKIKIWGYDLVRPDQRFNVQLYLEFVSRALLYLWSQGKLPIVVGGTGFFLRSMVNPPESLGVPVNQKLRVLLQGMSAQELYTLLVKKSPMKALQMTTSDKLNSRRLIRVLEIVNDQGGSPLTISPTLDYYIKQIVPELDVLEVGLTITSRQLLYEWIDERVEHRLLDKTLTNELEYLIQKDYLRYAPEVTIGYQQLIKWMGSEISFEEMVKQWKFAEHGYARRQLTWFKKQTGIHWFEVNEKNFKSKVEKLVREWYDKNIKQQKSNIM